MIVVDASVVVTALADDGPDGERHRSRLAGEVLIAPHLIDVEVVSAWRRLSSAGKLDERRARLAREDLRALPVSRIPHTPLLDRCWDLRQSLTAYDAVYVALAEVFEVPLLTADAKLAAAHGSRCAIEVVH